jgi:hypothetical protein
MRIVRPYGLGIVLVGAGVALYVRRRCTETGLSYLDVLKQLPGEARKYWDDTRRRGLLALEDGLSAAHRREEEVLRAIAAVGAAEGDAS